MADPKLVEYFESMETHLESEGEVSIYQRAGMCCWKNNRAIEAEAWLRLHCDTYLGSKGGMSNKNVLAKPAGDSKL